VTEEWPDYGYPVSLGRSVTWNPATRKWRVEVVSPRRMTAAFLDEDLMAKIVGTESHDERLVSDLVQRERVVVESHISLSWMEHWPEELGISYEGRPDGFYLEPDE
jgi:hypothetical protein